MSDFNRGFTGTVQVDKADMSVDSGLRSFMLGVYNKVALGLVLSAALAFLTGTFPPVRDLMFKVTADGRLAGMTLVGYAVAFGPLAIMLFSGFARRTPDARSASVTYWSIVSLMGASLGVLTFVYTGASIASTFLITAAAFGGLSLVGYTTKKDLTAMGSFLIMGVFGLVIASLVGMFWNPDGLQLIISVLGVLIFSGLIAYDTQRLKMMYYELSSDGEAMSVATSFGALNLYLNFINLFQFLLRLVGDRR